jgi:hypothetical protein
LPLDALVFSTFPLGFVSMALPDDEVEVAEVQPAA